MLFILIHYIILLLFSCVCCRVEQNKALVELNKLLFFQNGNYLESEEKVSVGCIVQGFFLQFFGMFTLLHVCSVSDSKMCVF